MLPPGLDGQLMSAPDAPIRCSEFVASSPECTIYHSAEYIEFARRENGAADMLVVRAQGTPLFGLPAHPTTGGRWISTGYSGVLFPASERESVLRTSVAALRTVLGSNPDLGFRVQQSAQASTYENPDRVALIGQLLCDDSHDIRATYTRALTPTATSTHFPAGTVLDGDVLDNEQLAEYDPDIRNQVRQALRRGLRVDCIVLDRNSTPQQVAGAYQRYLPLHVESCERTGMTPHALEYWLGLSNAVRHGGGTDVVVLASDAGGADVAAVTCHVFRRRAIYWSGCSTESGKAARGNPLALHAAITVCGSLGVTAFELGRFDANEGSEKELSITRYKAQFRGKIGPVLNFSRPPQTLRSEVGALARAVRTRLPRIVALARRR